MKYVTFIFIEFVVPQHTSSEVHREVRIRTLVHSHAGIYRVMLKLTAWFSKITPIFVSDHCLFIVFIFDMMNELWPGLLLNRLVQIYLIN